MPLPLEDQFYDIIHKAQRGQGINDQALALRTGLSMEKVLAVKEGLVDEESILKIGNALSLGSQALLQIAKNAWQPKPVELEGLKQFTTSYKDMTVNSYIMWDPATKVALAFDTGADATPMIEFINEQDLLLANIFITHSHPDHVIDLERLKRETGGTVALINNREPYAGAESFAIEEMAGWLAEGLRVEPRSTWGHSRGGTSYLVKGLAKGVVIVGDAMFAGSMGSGLISYSDALRTNRSNLLTLTRETVVCPGHGPMSTILEERAHNPFFPEYQEPGAESAIS
jgi:glyoxylase-like metal-dependent hydrolase (beta-lactamase superfamily II)